MSEIQNQQQEIPREPIVIKEKDYEFYYKQRSVKQQKTDRNVLLQDIQQLQRLSRLRKNPNQKSKKQQQKQFTDNKKPLSLAAQKLLQRVNIKAFKNNSNGNKNNILLQKQTSNAAAAAAVKNNPLGSSSNKKISNNPLNSSTQSKTSFNPLSSAKTNKNPLNNPLASQKKGDQSVAQQKSLKDLDMDVSKSQIQTNNDNINNNEEQQQQQEQEIINFVNPADIREHYWKEVRQNFIKIFEIKPTSSKMNQMVVNPFGSAAVKSEDRQAMKQAKSGQYAQNPQSQSPQKELTKITIKNYLQNLEERYNKMNKKWDSGDKVASLQITIQQIKLLMENENPKFAPVKYVYVMDILEKFGYNLIFRMKKMAFPNKTDEQLKLVTFAEIQGSSISEQTQEVARNWLKKIGSIRELLPRMYIEITLLPIHYFLDASKIRPIIIRATKMSRAIGDYINSIYFSTFFLRMCSEIIPNEKEHILSTIKDFFFYMKQGTKFFGKPGITGEDYFELFVPFLDTAFKYYTYNCSESEFYDLFEAFKESNQHREILAKIIQLFPTHYIAQYAGQIFGIIQHFHVDVKAIIYTRFLPKICSAVQNKTALQQICQLVWLDLSQVNDLNLFLNILASLIELIQKSYTGFQKTKYFSDVLDKFNTIFQASKQNKDQKGSENDEIMVKLENFMISILQGADNVNELITLEPLQQFISFFPNETKAKISVQILNIYLKKTQSEDKILDPIIVHSLLSIAKQIIESQLVISAGDKISLSNILRNILKKVDFGKDLEQMLNLYTDIRANFGQISTIVEMLIYKVIDLTFVARKLSKSKQNQKIRSFMQACLAFCFISIPMVIHTPTQIQFFNLASQVALVHNLISQSDAIFKSALNVLIEMPEQIDGKNVDEMVQGHMKTMLGQMVVLPDDPEHDYLHLFQGFQKLISVFQWSKKNGEMYKLSLLTDFLKYLSIQIQEKLPYHIEGVISNDQLFAEPEFKEKIVDLIQETLQNITETQNQILNRKDLSTDVYTNVDIVRNNLQLINTLLQYFKANKSVNGIILQAIIIIDKRCQNLISDKIGKIQLKGQSAFIKNTFANLEKNQIELEQYGNLKDTIYKQIERSQQSGF